MRCEVCRGERYIAPKWDEPMPCPECNGQAITHCCDGLQAQPERELYAIDRIVNRENL